MPLIEHLRAAERHTGTTPQVLLDAPPCPQGCEDLWATFLELSACRGNNGFGPTRITYVDIDAYQRVRGVKLQPWELACIRAADKAYLASYAEQHSGN